MPELSTLSSDRDSRCRHLTQGVVIVSGVVPGVSVARVTARTEASERELTWVTAGDGTEAAYLSPSPPNRSSHSPYKFRYAGSERPLVTHSHTPTLNIM
ncbi:hypothetical protein E2C01_078116 [Portunus trituberculatus]|uniref:Uncharacterized protein n=1 Tax=Portunus trituberculatus TaxID=210409 RepID=A0A5B7IP65_PORTR|nr:hypothetical protein [Portunus trituberculatus]